MHIPDAATTKPQENVIAAMQPCVRDHPCNPSALYATAKADVVRDARVAVADLLDVNTQSIVFTSGRSEANNLASKHQVSTPTAAVSLTRTYLWIVE